jgi:GH25 family lysozyme M1 (1,4-beta-N-acetylmuramidase)
MTRFPRFLRRPRHASPLPRRRFLLAGLGLVLAASSVGAGMLATRPAGHTAVDLSADTGASLPSLSYMKAQAKYHYMGYELPRRPKTSPPNASAAPLLRQAAASSEVLGVDVSSYQGNVNWNTAKSDGTRFAYVKATEATYYTNPYFAQQYTGSYNAGIKHGAYAFAIPNYSSGTSQADFLASHGGAWSADSMTLPAALDIEYNPYGAECYGLSHSAMVSWIKAFISEYYKKTGRYAVIYSTYDWWNTCTGNSSAFSANDPLWIARYASSAGTLPAGWPWYSFWQYTDNGILGYDTDLWNGSLTALTNLANNK